MTFEDDYRRAKESLHKMNELANKVTAKAKHRIAAHSLKAQLEAHLGDLRAEFGHDQADVATAFEADRLGHETAFVTNPQGLGHQY